jgi:hypothetical protein
MAIKKAGETSFKSVKPKAAKTVTMKSLVVEVLTWDNLAIAKYGTTVGLKSGQKAAVTREFNRRRELLNPLTTEELPAPKAATAPKAPKAPKAVKKSLKTVVVDGPLTYSNLASAMYGPNTVLTRGQIGAIQRELNRRANAPAPVTITHIAPEANDDKTKYPSKYIKTLLPEMAVDFNTLAEAMYGTSTGLNRPQTLIVQQEITRRRFRPIE